jgi:DNA-binding MarR family transcriptional regulator
LSRSRPIASLHAKRKPAQPVRPRSTPRSDNGHARLDQTGIEQLVGYNIRRAEIHMRQDFERSFGPKKLRPPEFSTLALIAANRFVTQADLAHALSIRRPNMVGLIDGLERRGLVTRTVYERDRRNHVLGLTPKGAALLEEAKRIAFAGDRRATSCWTDAERAQVIALLQRLYRRD